MNLKKVWIISSKEDNSHGNKLKNFLRAIQPAIDVRYTHSVKKLFFLAGFLAIAITILAGCGASNFIAENEDGQKISLGIQPEDPAIVLTNPDLAPVGVFHGERAVNFALRDFDGNVVKLSDFSGQPTVLVFWGSWCPICLEELQKLETLFQTHKEQNVAVVGVHPKKINVEDVHKTVEVSFPLLQDQQEEVFKTYSAGFASIPLVFFINRDGVIVEKWVGPKTSEELEESLAEIL